METTKEGLEESFLPTPLQRFDQYSYEGVANPKLKAYLEYFEGSVIQTILGWPTRADGRIWARMPSPSVSSADLATINPISLYTAVRKSHVLSLDQKKGSVVVFRKDTLRAFGALFGTHSIIRQDGTGGNPSEQITPEQLHSTVTTTRKLLGSHPLASLIHDLSSLTLSQTELQESERTTTAESFNRRSNVDRNVLMVRRRFPRFDQKQLKSLEAVVLDDLYQFLDSLPNDVGDVSYTHHKIPYEVAQAAVFILQANNYTLSRYDPDQDSRSLFVVREGIEICRRYLKGNPKIGNLSRLVEAIKKIVMKEPMKYWEVPVAKSS